MIQELGDYCKLPDNAGPVRSTYNAETDEFELVFELPEPGKTVDEEQH